MDMMSPFVGFLLKKLDRGETLRSTYEINSAFLDCFSDWGERLFACQVVQEQLNVDSNEAMSGLKIHFNVPQPLDLIFDKTTLDLYETLFRRLL